MYIKITPKASSLAQKFVETTANSKNKAVNIMEDYFRSNFSERVNSYAASHGTVGTMLNKLI